MKQREAPLELGKNLGKTMVVQNTSGRGPGVPGFYCEACNRTYKDSNAYLDHINGRSRAFPLVICDPNRPTELITILTDRLARPRPND
jgi:hypothetical protein